MSENLKTASVFLAAIPGFNKILSVLQERPKLWTNE